jgi:hypothetical protein
MRKTMWCAVLLIFAAAAFAQINTSVMDGTVTDPQGALIPHAEVTVTNTLTGQKFSTVTDDKGHWAIPALPTAIYGVAVTAPGFKKAQKADVKMDAGIPSTVNLVLEVGAVSEVVEVVGGAEVVQSTSATVSSDLTGRQVNDLPIPSRNATDLIVTLPGTNTPAGPRNTTFDGLPQATVNMTLDGVNIQDNLLKNGSGGAFYPVVYPRTDAIEEVSVTTAASGAESLGEGAIQVKFVTKSGTNNWHGGGFWQERNTFFDANTYFNNIDGLARDRIMLHQVGAHIGGPIVKNKLFIFFNYEVFRFPQSWNEAQDKGAQLTVLTDPARNGIFTYKDSSGQLRTVDLYTLAASSGYPSTPDPLIANTLSQISAATAQSGILTSRATANDYNRNNYNFLAPGEHKIDFPQGKLDWIINSKHHWEATGGVNPYRLFPDGINAVIPVFPGSGTVLGSKVNAGQREAFWTGSTALRSTWTPRLTSEIRFGMSSGNVLFFNDVGPSLFAPWRGYAPNMAGFVTVPYNANTFSRRNDPVGQLQGSLTWVHGSHLVNVGGSASQIGEWQASWSTQAIPRVSFGVQSTDPILSLFSSTNFPGSSASDLTNAENLYALLTGRVSSITQSVVLGEQSKTFGNNPVVSRYRQREFGLYIQDSWKINPRLTVNYGLRLENQYPFHSLNNTFTRPGYAGLFGTSGVGNLFQPGASGGAAPQLSLVGSDTVGYSAVHFPSPTVGVAFVLPKGPGPLGWLLGHDGNSVLRGGYSIATIREQFTVPWSGNQGVSINTSSDPISTNTAAFGAAGSVLFRNATLPSVSVPATPSYPLALAPGNTIADYDPNIKNRYVESWNVGFQRTLTPDTVLEVRYVGNLSARAWATLNLNEVNIVESGFVSQFQAAQNNLAIANGESVAQLTSGSLKSTNFFNQGLAGQKDVPIISTALASASNSTLANYVAQGQAGAFANSIAGNTAQMARLVAAGYPANLFQVNPATGGSAVNLTTNQGGSRYNSMQIELRRRLSHGLLVGASYTLSHAFTANQILSLRDRTGVTYPSAFDQRDGIKVNWVYELPIGQGHRLLASSNPVLRKAAEGWQVAGIARLQSGTPSELISGRQTFNGLDSGVVLHNITTSQLQSMVNIAKQGNLIVDYLPQSLINNTLAAFQLVNTPLDPSQPYIGPALTPGQYGNQVFLYGPWFQKWDVSLVKRTKLREGKIIEFRAQALNIFNHPNFFLVPNSSGNITINNLFGQTRNAFNDINSTNDPGSRVMDFQLRFSF